MRGHLGQVFDQVTPDHRSVVGGTLGGEDESTGLDQFLDITTEAAEYDAGFTVVDPAAEAVTQRVGLFHDLLEHEVVVGPQFDLLKIHVQFANFA